MFALLRYLHLTSKQTESKLQIKLLRNGGSTRHEAPFFARPMNIDGQKVVLLCPAFHELHSTCDHSNSSSNWDAAEPFPVLQSCVPLSDGMLIVVDALLGLPPTFVARLAATMRASPPAYKSIIFINKIDKLLKLTPRLDECFARVKSIVDQLADVLPSPTQFSTPLANVVFGRGSLAVVDGFGGWGFSLVRQGVGRRHTRAHLLHEFTTRI